MAEWKMEKQKFFSANQKIFFRFPSIRFFVTFVLKIKKS